MLPADRAVDSDEPLDAARFIVITDMSVITTPLEGYAATCVERLTVAGFGWSDAIPLAGVRVSGDGGVTWQDAEGREGDGPFVEWRFSAHLVVELVGLMSYQRPLMLTHGGLFGGSFR